MKGKYVTYALIVAVAMIGYNSFLAQRDQKLFDAYEACQYNHPSCPYNK